MVSPAPPPGFTERVAQARAPAPPPGFTERVGAPGAEQRTSFEDVTESLSRGMVRGIPIIGPIIEGGIERLEAAINAGLSDGAFADELEAIRTRGDRLREDRPMLSTTGEIVGGIAGSAAMVAAAPTAFGAGAGGLAARVGLGAASGAIVGGADVAVRGGDPVAGAALGAAGGAGGVLLGAGLGRLFAKHSAAPSAKLLQQQAKPLYDRAHGMGVVISKSSYRTMAGKMAASLKSAGFDDVLHPRASRVLTRMADRVDDISLEDAAIIRRQIGSLARSPEPDERRIGEIMIDLADDWLEGLTPADVLRGDAKGATDILVQARDLWARSKRAEILEIALERAEMGTAAADPATAIRNAFRVIANNPNTIRKFTPDQQTAIKLVAKGGPLQDLLNTIGTVYPAMIGGVGVGAMVDPTSGAATGAGLLMTKWASRFIRAGEARQLAAGAQLAATGTIGSPAVVPSAAARAVGAAGGLGAGLEVGREMAE